MNCYVISYILYGRICREIPPKLKERLEATENWFQRRLLRINWSENGSKDEVLEKIKTEISYTPKKMSVEFSR